MLRNELKPVTHGGRRVLTTQQIADAYETDNKVISNNFNRNKERYTEGKHYHVRRRIKPGRNDGLKRVARQSKMTE